MLHQTRTPAINRSPRERNGPHTPGKGAGRTAALARPHLGRERKCLSPRRVGVPRVMRGTRLSRSYRWLAFALTGLIVTVLRTVDDFPFAGVNRTDNRVLSAFPDRR